MYGDCHSKSKSLLNLGAECNTVREGIAITEQVLCLQYEVCDRKNKATSKIAMHPN
jgi:hypothetical protein